MVRPRVPPGWGIPLLLFGGLGACLLLGFLAKGQCLDRAWDGFQYRAMCYNDLAPQYSGRNFDQPGLPYVDYRPPEFHAVEYPVIVGMTEWISAQGVHTSSQFVVKNSVLIATSAFLTLWVLLKMRRPPRQLVRFVAAPSLIWAGFHNWDLFPVLFTVLAFYFHERGKPAGVGAALALGASAKFFPGFFVPIFLLHYWRNSPDRARDVGTFLAGGLLVGLAVNGPFMILNWDGWWWTFDFHLQRGVTLESVWWLSEHYLKQWGWIDAGRDLTGFHKTASMVAFFLLYLVPLARMWLRKASVYQGAWEVLLVFLLTSKVFSVQYEIWVLAFFAVLRIPWRQFVATEVAGFFVYVAIFRFFWELTATNQWDNAWTPWLAVGSWARHAVLGWMLVSSWTKRYETGVPQQAGGLAAEPYAPAVPDVSAVSRRTPGIPEKARSDVTKTAPSSCAVA